MIMSKFYLTDPNIINAALTDKELEFITTVVQTIMFKKDLPILEL